MSHAKDVYPWRIDPTRVTHLRQIGEGGFAVVFESTLDPAPDDENDTIKTGKTSKTTSAVSNGPMRIAAKHAINIHYLVDSAKTKFCKEVSLIYGLNNPYVVKTLGACMAVNQNMILMELLEGSLYDVIAVTNPANQHSNGDWDSDDDDDDDEDGKDNDSKDNTAATASSIALSPLPWGTRIMILTQIANGVAYLHGQHVIHRDLKAANVLVDRSLTPKLCDFGLAATKTSSSVSRTSSRKSSAVGTVAWMAPEAFRGGDACSDKTDTWGFGCVAVELITYDTPFAGKDFPNADMLREYICRHESPASAGTREGSSRGGTRGSTSDAPAAVSRPDVGLDNIVTSSSAKSCKLWRSRPGRPPSSGCPEELVELVHRCFARAQEQRPTMSEVAGLLKRYAFVP